eukprot:2790611-Amphidinium_carterae.1
MRKRTKWNKSVRNNNKREDTFMPGFELLLQQWPSTAVGLWVDLLGKAVLCFLTATEYSPNINYY